ncbi:hypothetical protein EE612_031160 [Oryza sativa]|nr:hypothetical protein EE612_031160 [Oryza sativa]
MASSRLLLLAALLATAAVLAASQKPKAATPTKATPASPGSRGGGGRRPRADERDGSAGEVRQVHHLPPAPPREPGGHPDQQPADGQLQRADHVRAHGRRVRGAQAGHAQLAVVAGPDPADALLRAPAVLQPRHAHHPRRPREHAGVRRRRPVQVQDQAVEQQRQHLHRRQLGAALHRRQQGLPLAVYSVDKVPLPYELFGP